MENQIVTRARANSSQSSNPSADSVTPSDKTLKDQNKNTPKSGSFTEKKKRRRAKHSQEKSEGSLQEVLNQKETKQDMAQPDISQNPDKIRPLSLPPAVTTHLNGLRPFNNLMPH